ncbi:HAD-IB family hydrolase [Actinosynnema sp. NPDC050801]|uniref:HAD family hydrolase n=1 Tax=unclassified Actinosynnema TaxID=2637065 RepID=UPI0034098C4B
MPRPAEAVADRAAFFDVDGTLITTTSLFRFLDHDLAVRGQPERRHHDAMAALDRLKAGGATREQANRAFYRNFAGRSVAELADEGKRWFAAANAAGGLFHPDVLARLRAHSDNGEVVVLLSASFPACVDPIAGFVGADLVVCTELEQVGGFYTGEVERSMVGAHKARAIHDLAVRLDLDLDGSYAYGDDSSDLAALTSVGRPVVVGDDPVLVAHATRHGWARVPAVAKPQPLTASAAPPGRI